MCRSIDCRGRLGSDYKQHILVSCFSLSVHSCCLQSIRDSPKRTSRMLRAGTYRLLPMLCAICDPIHITDAEEQIASEMFDILFRWRRLLLYGLRFAATVHVMKAQQLLSEIFKTLAQSIYSANEGVSWSQMALLLALTRFYTKMIFDQVKVLRLSACSISLFTKP